MTTSQRSGHTALDIVRTVRESRFDGGVRCVHCDAPSVIRWGSFIGRQRYRCKACQRTFSDLTRTPFAYTKRIEAWPHYLLLMRSGCTLRTSATCISVHTSTAFRWRHAVLRPMRTIDARQLTGTVELREILFAFSRKGDRSVHAPRRRGARTDGWRWYQVPRDRVLLGVTRAGVVDAETIGGDVAQTTRVRDWAERMLAGRCVVYARMPSAGPIGAPIRAAGHEFHMLKQIMSRPLDTRHTRNVDAYGRRLLDWLHRFRGVASRYRDNYLAWHRRVEYDTDMRWIDGMIGACIDLANCRRGQSDRVGSAKRPP